MIMARSVPWQRTCSDLVFWRQTEAQNATIYILRETGPTGFLLKEEGDVKPCKAFLGDPHSCTCTQFLKDRDLCKHICWLLLRKFRVPQTNPMSWQKGLVEREINELLRGLTQQLRKKVPTAIARWRRPLSQESDAREVIPQRDIADDDVCPICQDELLKKRLPVTYCKFGCGNSIHIKCMKIWAEHQKAQGETTVKCPFCREDFGPFEMLKYEKRNAEGESPGGRMDRHLGTTCRSCRMSPIEGKCYRCNTCADFYLCQSCFNTPIHTQHAFQYRHKRNEKWRAAGRAYGAVLPQAVLDDLVNREISDHDYELLMQLDSNSTAVGSDIPERVVQSFPLEKVRENGPLLQPGVQCRICLHGYQTGQFVRKLPRCKHKFHRDCIDNWLLHSRPTCPIDGQAVWDRFAAQLDESSPQANNRQRKKPNNPDPNAPANNIIHLEVPGIGLASRIHNPVEDIQGRAPFQVRGKPPIQRVHMQSHQDRVVQRIMASMPTNFAISGNAIAAGRDQNNDNNDLNNNQLPGSRFIERSVHRRPELGSHLTEGLHNNGIRADDIHDGIFPSQMEQDMDLLDQVAAANHDFSALDDDIHDSHGNHVVQERHVNFGSIFSHDQPPQPDITDTLLTNAERLSPYRAIPNIFTDVTTRQTLSEAVTSEDAQRNLEDQRSNLHHGSQRSNVQYGVFADVPPEQRLFASGSHIMFDPSQQRSTGNNSEYNSNQDHQHIHQSVSSAPASVNGERGRQMQRSMVSRNRSNSSERVQNCSRERGSVGSRTIPREGENLLSRLTMFTDLYLGNSPRSHPATTNTVPGLPPRSQHRQNANHAAARQRRFANERRQNNFSLQGNACNDVTLRDLL